MAEYWTAKIRALLKRFNEQKQYRVVVHCNNQKGKPAPAQVDPALTKIVNPRLWKWFDVQNPASEGHSKLDYDKGYELPLLTDRQALNVLIHALGEGRFTGAHISIEEIGEPEWEQMEQPTAAELHKLLGDTDFRLIATPDELEAVGLPRHG